MRTQAENKRRQRNEQKSFGNNNDNIESHTFSHTVYLPKLIIPEIFTVKKNVARGKGRGSGLFVFIYEQSVI